MFYCVTIASYFINEQILSLIEHIFSSFRNQLHIFVIKHK